MRTEDDWYDKVEDLRKRLEGHDADEHIRRIAIQEADKKVGTLTKGLVIIAVLWFAANRWHSTGVAGVLGVGFLYMLWAGFRDQRNSDRDRYLVVSLAEDLNRLSVIAEAHVAGEQVWSVEESRYERDKRKIVAFDGDRWNDSWRRIYCLALELERLGPKDREKQVLIAVKRARVPLEQGEALAKNEDGELTFWARNYLHILKKA